MKKRTGGRKLTKMQARQIVDVFSVLGTYKGTARHLGHSVTTVKKYLALTAPEPGLDAADSPDAEMVTLASVNSMLAHYLVLLADDVADGSITVDDALTRAVALGRLSTYMAPVER